MYIDLFGYIKSEKRGLFQRQVYIARTTGFDYNSSSYRQAKIYVFGMHTTNITVELPKKHCFKITFTSIRFNGNTNLGINMGFSCINFTQVGVEHRCRC